MAGFQVLRRDASLAQHHAPEAGRAMIWSILHSAETVRALLEGLLDAMEA
ncbi:MULTISPECIES: hypothetical protein [unclassified Pseudomonas]|nr:MULTISPECIES: hypothetical protein [unclassified Pseudomonas]